MCWSLLLLSITGCLLNHTHSVMILRMVQCRCSFQFAIISNVPLSGTQTPTATLLCKVLCSPLNSSKAGTTWWLCRLCFCCIHLQLMLCPCSSQFPIDRKISSVGEPTVTATVLTPTTYVGSIMQLCTDRRGDLLEHNILGNRTLLRSVPRLLLNDQFVFLLLAA